MVRLSVGTICWNTETVTQSPGLSTTTRMKSTNRTSPKARGIPQTHPSSGLQRLGAIDTLGGATRSMCWCLEVVNLMASPTRSQIDSLVNAVRRYTGSFPVNTTCEQNSTRPRSISKLRLRAVLWQWESRPLSALVYTSTSSVVWEFHGELDEPSVADTIMVRCPGKVDDDDSSHQDRRQQSTISVQIPSSMECSRQRVLVCD